MGFYLNKKFRLVIQYSNMVTDYSKRCFKTSMVVAMAAEIMAVVAIATNVWTKESGHRIGLWDLEVVDSGQVFKWTGVGEYEDFYYSTWMNGVRGMIIAGIVIGCLGILFNMWVLCSTKNEMVHGTTLMCYYFLAFVMVVSSVATYCCKIPQPVNEDDKFNSVNIDHYIFRGGYGYSMWFGWVGAGCFLPAAGLAYEGSNQKRMADRKARYQE